MYNPFTFITSPGPASTEAFRVADDLTELDQWVVWRYEKVPGRTKPTKVPYQVTGKRADSTSPRTWTTFENALSTLRRNRQHYVGIGFVFSKDDNLAGIDLDDCLDEQGNLKNWARGIVGQFSDTYMEISPGNLGLKIFTRGALPSNLPGVKIADGQIEIYDHSRFFAVTGRAFRGAPLQVEYHAADLVELYKHLTRGKTRWKIEPLVDGRIPYRQQHNTLVSLCGTLRLRRVCDDAIEACLQLVNAHQCERPGPAENISRIVRSSRKWVQV